MAEMSEAVDVVIVGAGPAGLAAALILAKAGKEVVVLERGEFVGAKNVFGGAIYTQPTSEIYPEFWKTAPVERFNSEHRFSLLTGDSAVTVSYKNEKHMSSLSTTGGEGRGEGDNPHYNSFTVKRANWDRWCAEQVEAAGAYIVPQTVVRDLLWEGERVVGVRTEQEDFPARITLIADGVNSLLVEKAGLRSGIPKPSEVALGVKEVIKLEENLINERFNSENGSGVIYTILGGAMEGITSMGFIYTNRDSIVVGLGASLYDLQQKCIKPYELLEQFKKHSMIRPLISGGELVEYSGHMIPEGGFHSMPKLYRAGTMVIGDAAMLVNNVHWEGTNLAMTSGRFAAETAIQALENSDFSEYQLALYEKLLRSSYVIKDLETYRNILPIVEKDSDVFMGFYPKQINALMETLVAVDGIPKKEKLKQFMSSTLKKRSIARIVTDMVKLGGPIL